MAATDRRQALQETIREPCLIWCYRRTLDGNTAFHATLPPDDHAFRWLHLNLSDQRSLRWLEEKAELPPQILALMLTRDSHQHFAVEGDALGLVLHDFERDFDPSAIGRIGSLHVALLSGWIVTGRYRPLHSADIFRARLEEGQEIADASAALGFLLGTLIDSLAAIVLDLSTTLLDAEEALLTEDQAPDTRELIATRRRSAQLHRMIGGMRVTLQRMERHPALPGNLAPVAEGFQLRLSTLEADIVSAQNQLRLLRDELDLQATQRTNANVYLLSILTALMMPATLITGFFGMNTGGLPLAQGEYGTLVAAGIAIFSGVASWLLLRAIGLVRSR